MPQVPLYQQTERQRPIARQGIDVQASPGDFGAQVGEATQRVGQGVGAISDAFQRVQELQDESIVRQRRNAMMQEKRDLLYNPETGYLMQSGQNALDQRSDVQGKLRGIRDRQAEGLSPSQARMFSQTADVVENDGLDTIIRHAGSALKEQIVADGNASADNFLNEALVNFQDQKKADKYIAAGVLEIRNLGSKQGWTADVLDQKERNYISNATQKMALRIATTSPIAAQAFITKHADRLSADDKFELDTKLKPIVQEAEADAKADELLKMGRDSSARETKASPAKGGFTSPSTSGRTMASEGPTKARAFLISKAPGKGAAAIDGLDSSFATNLAAMIQDAPPGIREGLQIGSGYRSNERQKEIFADSDGSGRRVAFPAGYRKPDGSIAKGSNHLHGKAVDLTWNGKLLKPGNAPQEVIDWVHQNVGNYGMYFRMSWEPWHVEPTRGGSTVASKVDGPVPRVNAPSYDQIQTYLGKIEDPIIRRKTEAKIVAGLEQQNKIQQINQTNARQQLWEMWERDKIPPSQAPVDLRIAAGNTAIDSLEATIQKDQEGRVVTNQSALFALNRMAAENPENFKRLDLTDYYSDLSREDRKAMSDQQNKLLSGDVQAQQSGELYNQAFRQAEISLNAVGLTTTGIAAGQPTKRAETEQRIARFQNELKREIDQYRSDKKQTPRYDEVQSMINALLMKSVYTVPRGSWSPMRLFDDGEANVGEGFMFERGNRPDGSKVKPVVEFEKIPPEWQTSIRSALTERTGKAPTRKEIEVEYAAVVMEILGQD